MKLKLKVELNEKDNFVHDGCLRYVLRNIL